MPTFTVTYSSDFQEVITSTVDDQVGAPPPIDGVTFETDTAGPPSTDLQDAAPPPIQGQEPVAVDGWQGDPNEAPPAIPGYAEAVVPGGETDDLGETGPPPII